MPFSRNVTAYVAMTAGSGDLLMLWNYFYRKLIIVQAIGLAIDPESVDPTNEWLEKIQGLLGTVDFEHSDIWAYLIDRPSGPRIIQRPRELYRIPCDFLWAPRVDVTEIEITILSFMTHGIGQGVWRGKEFDIVIGCDDLALRLIERETRGYKAVLGMDLTYELVAHIFIGDRLFGILTEPSHLARPFRGSDRAVVFAAFAKLERASILHSGLIYGERFMIDHTGKVRLFDLYDIRCYAPHERRNLEEDAQKYHWDRLQTIFDDIGSTSVSYPLRYRKPTSTILAPTPSPERFFLIAVEFGLDLHFPLAKDETTNRRRKQSSKSARGNPKTLQIGTKPLGPKQGLKAFSILLSNTSRNIEPNGPPPYTEFPRFLMLAPEPEDTNGASIVELE
ncbi:hypothetical protein B0H13DRAFT_2083487 [Mycena leptocephala]|nr:hypothetical protein B0H13DRAFT_2083487 [Mycena leptocephala]